MPGNMKCGRLRFSNCFVVFFPFLSRILPRSRFFVQLDSLLPFLSFHRSGTLQRISTYTIPRLSSVLSSSFSFFFFFPIPIPPFLISSFLPCGLPSPFVTSTTSWFLCLVFARFPLDYSIDPRDSRVSSLFNLLIYEYFSYRFFFLKKKCILYVIFKFILLFLTRALFRIF